MKVFLTLIISACFTPKVLSIVGSPLNPHGPVRKQYVVNCIYQIIQSSFKTGFLTMTSTEDMSFYTTDLQYILFRWLHNQKQWSIQIIGDSRVGLGENYVSVPKGQIGLNIKNKHRKGDYYIVIVDTMANFESQMEQVMNSKSFNVKALFVVYVAYLGIDSRGQAELVLNFLWKSRIINAVVVTSKYSHTTNNIYGLFPFASTRNCEEDVNILLLDKCEYGLRQNDYLLFPNKVPSVLNNCSTKVLAIRTPPSVIDVRNHTGFEIEVLNMVASKMNISFEYTVKNKSDYIAFRSKSKEWEGALKFIKENAAVGIGNMYANNEIYEDFALTSTYHFEQLTWAVPRANPAPRWKCLIAIFETRLWLACFAVYLTSSVLLYFVAHVTEEKPYNRLCLALLSSLGLLISVSFYKQPTSKTLRVIFIMTVLYGLIVTAMYQSALINVLTNPLFETQIKTQEDIMDSGLRIGGLPEYKSIFDTKQTMHIHDRFVTNTSFAERDIYDWLVRVASVKDTCTISNRFYIMYIQSKGDKGICDEKGVDQLFLPKRDILTYPITMIASQGFPFYEEFEKTVSQIITGGLTIKLLGEIREAIKRNTRAPATHEGGAGIKLTIEYLQGAFVVLIFGHVVATVVFLLEIVVYKLKRTTFYTRMLNKASLRQVNNNKTIKDKIQAQKK